MATNEFLSDNVVFQTRSATLGGTWKTWVCNTALNGTLGSTVNELITKCGTIQTPSNVTGTINFSGAANTSITASQVSLKDASEYTNEKTLLEGRLVNLEVTPLDLGVVILMKGDGYVTSFTVNADTGQPLTFDAVFSFSGTIDTDESDES
jgi:hypothetical protein